MKKGRGMRPDMSEYVGSEVIRPVQEEGLQLIEQDAKDDE